MKKKRKDLKFKSIFASKLTKVTSSDIDKYISLAGLEKLKPILPASVNLSSNPDLIGIVLNAAVGGLVNLNGDAITIEQAVNCAKNFNYKYVDIEHKRQNIVGVICNAGFSELGTNKILSEEEALKSNEPINISLACLLYSPVLSEEFVQFLQDSADENHKDYGAVSASWEIAFEDYDIYVGEKEVSKAAKVENRDKYEQYLISNGGTGKNDDGYVYRVVKGEILYPLGIGLVSNPAANVKGLYVLAPEEKDIKEDTEEDKIDASNLKDTKAVVIETIVNNFKDSSKTDDKIKNSVISNIKNIDMKLKITKLDDLTDESLKEVSVASIKDFLFDEIKKSNEKFEQEANLKETEVKTAKEKSLKLETDLAEAAKTIKDLTEKVQKFTDLALAQEKQAKFNERMAYFDEKFELSDEKRKAICAGLKDLSDADFEKYKGQMEVLLETKKSVIQAAAANATSDTTLKDAAQNATTNTPPPNGTDKEPSLKDKFAEAFSGKNVTIKIGKQKR